MKNAIIGAVVGMVLAVFGTLFYVNAVSTVINLNGRVAGIENFLNKQIEMSQKQAQQRPPLAQKPE